MRTSSSLLLVFFLVSSADAQGVVVEDVFGRRLNENGLVLVDWEGHIANPAIKFYIVPPPDAVFPARALLAAKEPRLYFNLPSEIGPNGPRKLVDFKKREKMPVLISIFPDRDDKDEDHVLEITFQDSGGRVQALKLRCHVTDQDKNEAKGFPITVDFSQDRTGFFKDDKKRQVVTRAAKDWMEFFEPLDVDPVGVGKEKTYIWDTDSLKKGKYVNNTQEFAGFLLYAYGVQTAEMRSGGEPSRDGGFQSHQGKKLSIHRSGGVELETRGNFNNKGWLVSLADNDFWKATNRSGEVNDFYSVAHHEIGHALIFNFANPLFEKAKKKGMLQDAALKKYLGGEPKIDNFDHLPGTTDPASRRGAFGEEFKGEMPLCRWLITKLDLLCARAIGWPLRETSAFAPLKLLTAELPAGAQGRKYSEKLRAAGGIPFYHWEITAGSLPAGLKLNSFTGEISGVPTKAGTYELTIRVRDYDENATGESAKLRAEIAAAGK